MTRTHTDLLDALDGLTLGGAALELGRINVFMGTNGTGKSMALRAFAQELRRRPEFRTQQVTLIYTRGGRSLTFDEPKEQRVNWPTPKGATKEDPETRRHRWETTVRGSVFAGTEMASDRLRNAIRQLEATYLEEEFRRRRQIVEWYESGQNSAEPGPRLPFLQPILDLFSEVFPEIHISEKRSFVDAGGHAMHSLTLQCVKNDGPPFSLNGLSDGEKQVLAFILDRYFARGTKSVIIVDEPELNLDPAIACRFWGVMEREIPEGVFIYATHSIDFAMRDDVENTYLLRGPDLPPVEVTRAQELPLDDLRCFFGAARGVVSREAGIAVEGGDDSLDVRFYRWALRDSIDAAIVPMGSCHAVHQATTRLDLWRELVPNCQIVGVIDRDYRSDDETAGDNGCVVLDLHECESYLCHPATLSSLAKALQIEDFPTEQELEESISAYFDEQLLSVVARRALRRYQGPPAIKLSSGMLQGCATVTDVIEVFSKAVEFGSPPAGTQDTARMVREEYERCTKVRGQNDLLGMLRLAPGKELLGGFVPLFGLASRAVLMHRVQTHLSPIDCQPVEELRRKILSRFR